MMVLYNANAIIRVRWKKIRASWCATDMDYGNSSIQPTDQPTN